LTVKSGSLTDQAFLADAFAGQDVAMFALHFMAIGAEAGLCEAAAKAGVKWIVPNEYAADGLNEAMVDSVPVFQPKRKTRQYIEELSKTHEGLKWIGVATNPFFEMTIQRKLSGIDQDAKTATLYPDAGKFNVSTMDQIGRGIANLLSLPIKNEEDPRKSLEHYANNFVYISSFLVSQSDLLAAIQRAQGTKEDEWKVDKSKTVKEWISTSRDALAKGDQRAGFGLTFAYYIGEGLGGNYEDKAQQDKKALALPDEDFDEAVKRALGMESLPQLRPTPEK
jgi:hypothetical protein